MTQAQIRESVEVKNDKSSPRQLDAICIPGLAIVWVSVNIDQPWSVIFGSYIDAMEKFGSNRNSVEILVGNIGGFDFSKSVCTREATPAA